MAADSIIDSTRPRTGPLRVGLFGAGRVAGQLGPALLAAGHAVVFVWSRHAATAETLAAALSDVAVLLDLRAPLPHADVYLLAIPDAAVAPVLAGVAWPAGAVVAHLAGALPLGVFEDRPQVRGGVLYPLQTFSPGRAVDWASVPLCVEAADTGAQNLLLALAHSLSGDVRLLASADGADGSVSMHQDARIFATRPDDGIEVVHALGDGRNAYVHVARGGAEVNGHAVLAGDGVKLSGEPVVRLKGVDSAELLLFDLP